MLLISDVCLELRRWICPMLRKWQKKKNRIPKYHMSINRQHPIPKYGPTSQIGEYIKIHSYSRRSILRYSTPHHQPENSSPSLASGKRSTLKRTTGTQASNLSNIRTAGIAAGCQEIQKSDRSHSHLHACIHDAIPRKQSRWPSSKRDLLPPEDQALIPNQYRKQKEPARTAKY
jgi:hypothetical protein